MTTLSFVDTTRNASAALVRPGIALTRLHNDLWRVTRPAGDVLGYVESFRLRPANDTAPNASWPVTLALLSTASFGA